MTVRCPKCGEHKPTTEYSSDRTKASGRRSLCKPCDNAKARAYYLDNREARLARAKAQYTPPVPRKLECCDCGIAMLVAPAAHRRKRCDPCRAEHEKQRNNSRMHVETMRRRTQVQRLTDITPAWLLNLKRQAKACPLCSVTLTREPGQPHSLQVDHIVPIAAGGAHTQDNLRALCARCNQSRPHDGSDLAGMQFSLTMVDAHASPDLIDPQTRSARRTATRRLKEAKAAAKVLSAQGRFQQDSLLLRVRAHGAQWEDIAALTHSDNPGAAYGQARRAGPLPTLTELRAA